MSQPQPLEYPVLFEARVVIGDFKHEHDHRQAGERHVGSAREEESVSRRLLLELRADVKMRIRRFRASDS